MKIKTSDITLVIAIFYWVITIFHFIYYHNITTYFWLFTAIMFALFYNYFKQKNNE